MGRPVSRRGRAWALALLIAIGLWGTSLGFGLGSGTPDDWARFIATGDGLAARGDDARAADGLSPRAAYLLAFHHAQDAADVARMRVAANRLERLGEPALAEHVRDVATEVERSLPPGGRGCP